ncbi:MAG TPA: DUF1593 domain-containing protein [Sedimentisphaerales bacterium]|nr:DUF1593 domain-containing protein [Sedimentisphaerales bacterium]
MGTWISMDRTAVESVGYILLVLGLIAPGRATEAEVRFEPRQKPRVIVLTDITNEPDDEQSMVRFLVYSNEFDVEGMIATTSVWLRDEVRPDKIRQRVEAFGKVRENLLRHASGYPTAEHLRSVTKSGRPVFGMEGVGPGCSSEGSRHIIEVVDRPDPRPVWISVWGGANCLAQALWDVKSERSEADLNAFVSKLRVYTISDQDDSGRWLRATFPTLFYIVTPSTVDYREYYKATWTGISGDRRYRNGPMHAFDLMDNPWLEENIIHGHGPLGALYPRLEYIMEGDTPSFFNLIGNGLGGDVSPAYGGWGGRYVLYACYGETRPIWTNAEGCQDTVVADNGVSYTTAQATIWRWRRAYQHDFAARMDWCVADRLERANHNPVVVVADDESKAVVHMVVRPGQSVLLDAAGTHDPDGDALAYRWFVYEEAGTHRGPVEIEKYATPQARLVVPNASSPRTIHVILEVVDDGQPSLYSYRRTIVQVQP